MVFQLEVAAEAVEGPLRQGRQAAGLEGPERVQALGDERAAQVAEAGHGGRRVRRRAGRVDAGMHSSSSSREIVTV